MTVPVLHSDRLNADVLLGKHDATPIRSTHTPMRDLLKALPSGTLPPVPAHWGHGYDFPGSDGWGMLGNGPCDDDSIPQSDAAYQGAGDCAWAGPAHEEMEAAHNSGRPVPKFTCLNVLQQYAAYSGYDLQTGGNDNGSNVQDVLAWRQTKGLQTADGETLKIRNTVSLTPGDLNELWAAAYLFECAGIGINFQQAQMDQFDAGEPWAYVAGSSIEGGHYIPVLGPTGLVSWGRRVPFAHSLITNLCDEAFAYVDPERYSQVTGKDAEGHDDADLELYITLIAQAKTGA